MFPMPLVFDALRDFTENFPMVPPRIYVESLGAAAERILDGTGMIGLLPMMFTETALLQRFPLTTIKLLPVVAADHPLAAMAGPIATTVLHSHVQLVLTNRSMAAAGRDFGVLSGRTWRIADLGAKQAMLLAGLGWGNMPAHLVADDIARGRLAVITPAEWHAEIATVAMSGAYLAGRTLGRAGRWMVEHLSAGFGRPLA